MGWIAAFALALLLLPTPSHAQEMTVTTFAGPREVPGVTDGNGTEARFRSAVGGGLACDRQGNVYVADADNHTIRKVAPWGAVTTLAGLMWTQGRQNGPGSVARFVFPYGVTTDANDNVYVADTFNNTIRKITRDGMVSTIAGSGLFGSADGPAKQATFYWPEGIAVGKDGAIYVADTSNHTIRKISPAGEVTTIAGKVRTPGNTNGVGTAAGFYYPTSPVLDEAGNLYVADQWNHVIRKVTPEGTVTTFCGGMGLRDSANGPCPAARFAYPEAIAITRLGEIYVSDTFNFCIRKIDAQGSVTTVAGSPDSAAIIDGPVASARFDYPAGITVDSAGVIYVMDGKLRKISDGVVSTVAGIAPSETQVNVDGVGGEARFESPGGIAVDPDGNLYVTDDYTIRKVTPEAEVSTMAGRPGVAGYATGPAPSATFDAVRGVAFANGAVFVSDRHNNAVKKIANGMVTVFAGSPGADFGSADGVGTSARFYYPEGITADGAENLYVADGVNHTIRKITAGAVVTTVAGSAQATGSTDGTGSSARFNRPLGVAVDGSGNVYVTDSENYTVRKISPSGQVTTLAGSAGAQGFEDGTGSEARFKSLQAITVDSDGTVYVGDDGTLRRIDPDGTVVTLAGSPSTGLYTGQLSGPGNTDGTGLEAQLKTIRGIAVMPNGKLFFTDNGVVRLARPVIPDEAEDTVVSTNPEILQLDTSAQTATSWAWQIMRRPADARANLSSSTARNPTFRADQPGLYVFRLTASGPAGARVSYVAFMSNVTPAPPPGKRRSARH